MRVIRRHMRIWVAAWLTCQVTSLSAFVPQACCAAHGQAKTAKCHGASDSQPGTHCPMRNADGAPCPMHRARAQASTHAQGHHADHAEHGAPATSTCSLRPVCDGPLAALAALFSSPGLPVETVTLFPDEPRVSPAVTPADGLISATSIPELPPPRA